MKKILIVANHFHPYIGGLEKFVLELANGLAKKGNKVDVLTFQYKKLKSIEKKDNIQIIRLPCFEILGDTYSLPKISSKEYNKLKNKIINEKYDVVFTNTRFFTSTYIGYKLAKKMKSKFIHIEHGNKFVTHKNPIVTICAWIYDQTIGRYVIKRSDLVVGISKKCSSFAKKLGARKTITIHNSIHTKEFEKIKVFKNEKTTITYVGRLIYAKGIQHIIEALENNKKYFLQIVGDGPYKKNIENMIKEKNVNAKLLGQKNKEEIKKILSGTDIFINPSYSEGLPTSILEAGAIGLPIIATDVGGTNEIINNNLNGLLVKPKSSLEIKKALIKLEDKELKEDFSNKIKKKIQEQFDWNKTIEKFEEIIN